MRAMGLARGGSLNNAIVVNGQEILNPEGLRFRNEFVRHKVLDSIGDLYLVGAPIIGHFQGDRAGHALTLRLLQALFAERSEEHTSELQSLMRISYAVFCLKKKNNRVYKFQTTPHTRAYI